MLCISLVQTVDFSLFLNLHISIHQDELTNCLKKKKKKKRKELVRNMSEYHNEKTN